MSFFGLIGYARKHGERCLQHVETNKITEKHMPTVRYSGEIAVEWSDRIWSILLVFSTKCYYANPSRSIGGMIQIYEKFNAGCFKVTFLSPIIWRSRGHFAIEKGHWTSPSQNGHWTRRIARVITVTFQPSSHLGQWKNTWLFRVYIYIGDCNYDS